MRRMRISGRLLGSVAATFLFLGLPFAAQAIVKEPASPSQSISDPAGVLPDAQEVEPTYAKGQLIVKFKDSVTECVHCLFKSKQAFKTAIVDRSDSLDLLNTKYQVSSVKSIIRSEKEEAKLHNTSISSLQQQYQQKLQSIKTRFARRTQRAPKNASIPDLSHVYILKLPEETNILEAVAEYAADPHVEYAQPDYIAEADFLPNDPYYNSSSSWGQDYDDLWGLKSDRLNLEPAWDITQGEDIIVAVVDTGLDYNHPDIASNVWINTCEDLNGNGQVDASDFNGVDDACPGFSPNGYIDDLRGFDFANSLDANGDGDYVDSGDINDFDPMDDNGHGTHVSGTIAAVGNNGIGIIGVAPQAKIMALKGLRQSGGGSFIDLGKAIIYAAENGADVINNSWSCKAECPINPWGEDAVRTAHGLGAVIVFSAGNKSSDVVNYSPKNMQDPKPIVVASTDHLDRWSDFSNFGNLVDIAAPGGESYARFEPESILSLQAQETEKGPVVSPGYIRLRGTSMAAPHAAGVAALILARRPAFTNDQVRHILRLSADDVQTPGFDVKSGAGRINAMSALQIDSVPHIDAVITEPISGSFFEIQQDSLTIIGTAAGDDFQQQQLFYGLGFTPTEWISIYDPRSTPVVDDVLGVWSINQLHSGAYTIKLVVTANDARQFEALTQVFIERPVTRITANPSRRERNPVISGERIVYEAISGGGLYPYHFDLATDTEQQIGIDNISVASPPAISGDRVVYVRWPNGNADIFLHDLATDTEQQITYDLRYAYVPDISGERIVWTSSNVGGSTRYGIYLYDLATGQEQHIITSDKAYNPAISGDKIVWLDTRNGNSDIFLYDLATGTEHQITTNPDSQTMPDISGNTIVWKDFRYYDDSELNELAVYICVFNPVTGNCPEQRITTRSSVGLGNPAISGNRIVWSDKRNGSTNSDIYLYDIDTGKEHAITAHPSYQVQPAISGNRIVWKDSRNGNLSDIYFRELNDPPFLEPIGHQTVAVGQLLTVKVLATDPDSDSLSFQTTPLPTGALFAPLGDVAMDGELTSADAMFITQYLAGLLELNEFQLAVADVNGDGAITDADSQLIANLLVGNVDPLNEYRFLWKPTAAQIGDHTVTFTVSDEELSDTETITINVIPNLAPTLQIVDPDVTNDGVVDMADINLIVAAFGTGEGSPAYDPALDLVPDGFISIHDITFAVMLQGLTWPPTELKVGQVVAFYLRGDDADDDALLFDAQALPEGATFNSATQRFQWVPVAGQAGSYEITFTVSDEQLTDSETISITVLEPQTPWQTNASGRLRTDLNWNYAMGYHFTPQVDGKVTKLGGVFNGTKTVKLFNKSTGELLSSTTVTGNNDWSYSDITPVNVTAGTAYTVAVYLAGSGGSYRYSLNPRLPQTYGDIRIEGATYTYTRSNPDARPTNNITSTMYGQADIGFVAD